MKSSKNLLLSFACYVILVVSAYVPLQSNHHRIFVALFSVIAIYFAGKSFSLKESKFGAISLILIGLVILLYLFSLVAFFDLFN